MKKLTLLILIAPFVACSSADNDPYVQSLVDAINEADRIVVTEHSSSWDVSDNENEAEISSEPIIYRSVELKTTQKALFVSTLERLDDNSDISVSLCPFRPHHTIDFYSSGSLRSKMQICFECDQAQWDRINSVPPMSLFTGLRALIEAVGMEPVRDWEMLAKHHLELRTNMNREADTVK